MNVLEKLNAAAGSSPKSNHVVITSAEYTELSNLPFSEIGSQLKVSDGQSRSQKAHIYGSKDSGATFEGVRIHIVDAGDVKKTA